MSTQTHIAVYKLYTEMGEASPINFEETEEEPVQDAVGIIVSLQYDRYS